MSSSSLALSVRDLSVTLGEHKILDHLSFDVKKGETLVVLGPNGAGKTTLLRAILGLLDHQGEVVWHAKNISYLPPNELLHRKNLLPLTVKDFYSLKNVSSSRVKKSLDSVGLSQHLLDQSLSSLSTGQFQRLSIAWALVDNPDTLIFDEPTSGIDIGGTETIYSLLHSFWEKHNLSIILVTHELNVVWEHANNVLCLNKKAVCHGTPQDVLTTKNLKALYGSGLKYHHH